MEDIKNLDREAIIKAISRIDQNPEIRYGRESTTYDLIFEGKKYPPILVLSEANKLAGGNELTLSDFNNSTDKAFSILSGYNFEIAPKSENPKIQERLISEYKSLVRKDQNKDELYKWELIQEFQKKWEADANDFSGMLQNINFGNLVDYRSLFFVNTADNYPEEARRLFKMLYDEEIPLKKRISDFGERADQLVHEVDLDKGAFQDERTIATYLTFRYPDKYTFYKYSIYSDFIDLLNIDKEKAGDRYIHYLSLIDNFINDYIKNDTELIELSRSTLTEDCFIDNKYNILAQDILYRTTQQENLNLLDKPKPFIDTLREFLEQSNTENLRTAHYRDTYNGLEVKVSFGQGNTAKIPWISFLHKTQSTSDGIYPVYLLFKDKNILILAYGISETNKPDKSWGLNNPTSIEKYFEENSLGKPHRYGSSYVFKVYDLDDSLDNYPIDSDLYELTSFYKEVIGTTPPGPEPLGLNVEVLLNNLFASNLIFENSLVSRFVNAIVTKPFLILTGLSGSGKTKLAQAFSEWIIENKSQLNLIPVGADWTNREPLLGYPNALEEGKYVLPESGALQLLLRAKDDPERPYFLILDEMNLSHVERYFADFLSAIESKEEIKLHSGNQDLEADGYQIPSTLSIPKNFFIIGTVNIDETTYMFSPKVLDRANVIEFRVSNDELAQFLKNPEDVELNTLRGQGAGMASDFVQIATNKANAYSQKEKLSKELLKFFEELSDVGAEFGYRTAFEINRFASLSEKLSTEWGFNEIMDAAIAQKLLPKLHGSRRKLEKVLFKIGQLCINEGDAEELLKKPESINWDNVKYSISFEKIVRMHKGLIENGFTSFAEA